MKKKVVRKPWGREEWLAVNEKVTVKILTVKPRQKLSLQKHKNRAEFWKFLDNPAKINIAGRIKKVKKGDEVFIRRGQLHRVESLSKTVKFLEVSFGNYSSQDIVRVEDDYGRV